MHVRCGMPAGTRIEVSHLFNSVPGREVLEDCGLQSLRISCTFQNYMP